VVCEGMRFRRLRKGARAERESERDARVPPLVRVELGVDAQVALLAHAVDLLPGPRVEGDALDLGDVGADLAVHRRALDAEEDALVPRGPPRVAGLAVGALVVAGLLEEDEELSLMALGGRL